MILIKFKDTVAPAVIIFLFCAHFSGVKTQDIQKGGGLPGTNCITKLFMNFILCINV
jgi:hypothetical protein